MGQSGVLLPYSAGQQSALVTSTSLPAQAQASHAVLLVTVKGGPILPLAPNLIWGSGFMQPCCMLLFQFILASRLCFNVHKEPSTGSAARWS